MTSKSNVKKLVLFLYATQGENMESIARPPKGRRCRVIIKPCNPNACVRDNSDGEDSVFTHVLIAIKEQQELHFFCADESEAGHIKELADKDEKWIFKCVTLLEYQTKGHGYIAFEWYDV